MCAHYFLLATTNPPAHAPWAMACRAPQGSTPAPWGGVLPPPEPLRGSPSPLSPGQLVVDPRRSPSILADPPRSPPSNASKPLRPPRPPLRLPRPQDPPKSNETIQDQEFSWLCNLPTHPSCALKLKSLCNIVIRNVIARICDCGTEALMPLGLRPCHRRQNHTQHPTKKSSVLNYGLPGVARFRETTQ